MTAEARIADKDGTISDLRHRFDEERAERRQMAERLAAAQERIAALLTHHAEPVGASRRRWHFWRCT